MIEEFERHLRGTNLSENTISSYLFAIRQYSSQYDGITKKNLRAYKVWLIENYKPKTVKHKGGNAKPLPLFQLHGYCYLLVSDLGKPIFTLYSRMDFFQGYKSSKERNK